MKTSYIVTDPLCIGNIFPTANNKGLLKLSGMKTGINIVQMCWSVKSGCQGGGV